MDMIGCSKLAGLRQLDRSMLQTEPGRTNMFNPPPLSFETAT